jgi:hypothetical protein
LMQPGQTISAGNPRRLRPLIAQNIALKANANKHSF